VVQSCGVPQGDGDPTLHGWISPMGYPKVMVTPSSWVDQPHGVPQGWVDPLFWGWLGLVGYPKVMVTLHWVGGSVLWGTPR